MTQSAANSFAQTMSTAAALTGIRFVQMPQILQPSAVVAVAATKFVEILEQDHAISPMDHPLAVTKNAAKQFALTTRIAVILIGIKFALTLFLVLAPKTKHDSCWR